jgi:hypothetical protein
MTKLRWPLPALFAWTTSWALYLGLRSYLLADMLAWLIATAWSLFLMRYGLTPMRRFLIAIGFPLSMLVTLGALSVPAWVWPALLVLVLLIYPKRAWQDAPLFPTPREALSVLPQHAPLPADARILDAGSGLGDGLIALRQAYPHAQLNGMEMSWPLRFLSALRCRWARIRQGDIWMADWGDYDMVYLFQRPETMPRAVQKAEIDLKRGAWLASLEFEARELQPHAIAQCPDGRPVWLYQKPFKRAASGLAGAVRVD